MLNALLLAGGLLFASPHYDTSPDSAVDGGGIAATDLDLNGNNLIMDAAGNCYWKDDGGNFIGFYCGSASPEFYLTTTGITFNGTVGHLRMGGNHIQSVSGVLEIGGSCTSALVSTGDLCIPKKVDIQDNLFVGDYLTMDGVTSLPTCDATTVRDKTVYTKAAANKISECFCAQTGAATYAWEATHASGDCI